MKRQGLWTINMTVIGSGKDADEQTVARARSLLAQVAQQFLSSHPQIALTVRTGGYGGVMQAALEGALGGARAADADDRLLTQGIQIIPERLRKISAFRRIAGVDYVAKNFDMRRQQLVRGLYTDPVHIVLAFPGGIGTVMELADAVGFLTKYGSILVGEPTARFIIFVQDEACEGNNACLAVLRLVGKEHAHCVFDVTSDKALGVVLGSLNTCCPRTKAG